MTMANPVVTRLDHLVLVAATLEQGAAYCQRVLGVTPVTGGRHTMMGTHNLLLNLGQASYLEIIAIDPQAPPPSRPRWFGMDDAGQSRRWQQTPALASFVAATNDIDAAQRVLPLVGQVTDMQRGTLAWRITLTADGAPAAGGTLPSLIQWPSGLHPTSAMAPPQCHLRQLQVFAAQPAALRAMWRGIGLVADDRVCVCDADERQGPALIATLDTPHGVVRLS